MKKKIILSMRLFFRHLLWVNSVYKVSALIIAILLWLIISSRREFEVVKNFDVEFRMHDSVLVNQISPPTIKVHLFGSRVSLKKVLDGQWPNSVVIDAMNLRPGQHRIRLERNRIELPFGARAISIDPQFVEFEIKPF